MPKCPYSSTIFANALRSLLVLASLSLPLAACQTLADRDDSISREKKAAATQKALIISSLDSGKPEDALNVLRGLLRETPDDADLNNLMGLTQLAFKNPERAIRYFMKAYKSDHSIAVALNLSSAYLESGEFNKAVTLLTAMTKQADKEKYPFKERIFHNLGYAHVRLNQLTQATSWLKEAIDENPSFFPSYLELARVYEKTSRPAMAAQTYIKASDYCQSCFEPINALALIYMKMGRFIDARALLVKFERNDGVSSSDRAAAKKLLKVVNNNASGGRRAG